VPGYFHHFAIVKAFLFNFINGIKICLLLGHKETWQKKDDGKNLL
jgi:hypothetical protein